jgi:hypothetical protein
MAKITVAGDAVVITSTLKLADIKSLEKYRPQSLVLYGGEDGKDAIYAIGTTEKAGSINEFGASFSSEAHDGSGLATITECLGPIEGDVKEFLADKIGSAIINLNKLEEKLPSVLSEVSAERAIVKGNITISQ